MAERGDRGTAIESGLSSSVRHCGRSYQVQTQCSERDAPVVESLIFHGGETLVRITVSYDELASRFGFSGADARHMVELQHSDLIRKIRHGMLQDDEDEADVSPPYAEDEVRLVDADGVTVDPSQIEEPAVLELLRELGVAIDDLPGQAPRVQRRTPEPSPVPRRPWWRRLLLEIRLPFGG